MPGTAAMVSRMRSTPVAFSVTMIPSCGIATRCKVANAPMAACTAFT